MALQMHHFSPLFIIVTICFFSCYSSELLETKGRGLRSGRKTFNVDDYGAKGDGSADDTQAFKKAWKKACSSTGAIFLVPNKKNYLVKPITFNGPCNSTIHIKVYGTILASKDRSDYEKNVRHWLVLKRINNLSVEGPGFINGNGKIWWDNSCKVNKKKPCTHAPTALTFDTCKNLVVKNLNIQNAQQMHVSFQKCKHVKAFDIGVSSPEDSPNTDGIHITKTQNIQIIGAIIKTGDDCISIENGSKKVRAKNITCGPGHGISIGSLGDDDSKAHVSDIIVDGATLSRTTNGLRIKTWQGGSGVANNITFQNIVLSNVKNPIIIDQNYCDQDKPCKKQSSAVQIRDVIYKNIKGTSSSEKAVVFDCSKTHPCQRITMQDIQIKRSEGGKKIEATCNNIQISKAEDVSPQCFT